MKRDDEYLRQLLFEIEADAEGSFPVRNYMSMPPEVEKKNYHVELLRDAGHLTRVSTSSYRMTNAGHDFLDAIRSDSIWKQTKDAVAETGGNATLEIMKQLAVGYLKKRISEKTGIEL